MAQRQFRSDDTDAWLEGFGNGSDGAYTPSTSTASPTDSACTGTAGTKTLSATNAGFAAGQIILIIQISKSGGVGTTNWELNKIDSYVAGTITTKYDLTYTYSAKSQVIVLAQFSSATISSGVTVTGKAWNGTTGGIYGFMCNGTVTIEGTISEAGSSPNTTQVSNKVTAINGGGFRGGFTQDSVNSYGERGENTNGSQGQLYTAVRNGGGGGGGNANFNAGGGGSHATAGANGVNSGSTNGLGATTIEGNAALTTMVFGGGGGGATGTAGASPINCGGNGGGIIFIAAKEIVISGSVTAKAGDYSDPLNNRISGGLGAGGSVLLKGEDVTLGTSKVNAKGGDWTNDEAGSENGGDGGDGRIHVDYSKSISGTTTPTLDSTQDSTIVGPAGGSFFLMF